MPTAGRAVRRGRGDGGAAEALWQLGGSVRSRWRRCVFMGGCVCVEVFTTVNRDIRHEAVPTSGALPQTKRPQTSQCLKEYYVNIMGLY